MSMRSLRCALLGTIVAVGCSSSQSADAGTGDGATPQPCGDAAACATGQLCVSRQDCPTSTCTPVPASGSCPPGSSATPSCPDGGAPGCLGGCAVTYACQARPAGCGTTLDCSCAAALCAPGSCLDTMGSRVACAAQ